MKSLLAPGIYKLGVTTSLERRLGEHGGRTKHKVIAWRPMAMDAARALERQVRTRFHSCLITNGNEIFALTDDQLKELLSLL